MNLSERVEGFISEKVRAEFKPPGVTTARSSARFGDFPLESATRFKRGFPQTVAHTGSFCIAFRTAKLRSSM
jgi:hypothetical protein